MNTEASASNEALQTDKGKSVKPMLSKFQTVAILLKPLRLRLFVGMPVVLVGGFFAAGFFDQQGAALIRGASLTLAWWLWLLFLIPRMFGPENRIAVKHSMFPRLLAWMRSWLAAFMVLAFAFPLIAPIIIWIYH